MAECIGGLLETATGHVYGRRRHASEARLIVLLPTAQTRWQQSMASKVHGSKRSSELTSEAFELTNSPPRRIRFPSERSVASGAGVDARRADPSGVESRNTFEAGAPQQDAATIAYPATRRTVRGGRPSHHSEGPPCDGRTRNRLVS